MNLPKLSKLKLFKLTFIISFAMTFAVNAKAVQITENSKSTEDSIYSIVDKIPEFQGGDKALISFIRQTVVYPAEALKKKEQGKVIVQFAVSKTGKVENITVIKSISPSLDNEAIRVIGLLPDWIPGELNGMKVSVSRVIPVMFQIPTEEEAWDVNDKTLILIDGVKMPDNFNTKILNPSKLTSFSVLKPFPKEEKSRIVAKYGKQAANGVVLISTNKDEMYYALADSLSNEVKIKIADCKDTASTPQFIGGKAKLLSYIADSIQYPFVPKQLKTQGKVIVRFKVNSDGKISDARVMKALDYYLGKEALRVISSMPNWIPGAKCEQKLNIYVTMPVTFKLDIPATAKVWEKNDKTIVLMDGERLPASFDLGWLNYSNLASYKVLQPGTKVENKKLVSEYGKDAVNGVILISTKR